METSVSVSARRQMDGFHSVFVKHMHMTRTHGHAHMDTHTRTRTHGQATRGGGDAPGRWILIIKFEIQSRRRLHGLDLRTSAEACGILKERGLFKIKAVIQRLESRRKVGGHCDVYKRKNFVFCH